MSQFNYEPKRIEDIIFGNEESSLRINEIVTNAINMPMNGNVQFYFMAFLAQVKRH